MSAITVRVKTDIINVAWQIFNLNLDSTFLSIRYKRIPEKYVYTTTTYLSIFFGLLKLELLIPFP